MLRDETKKAWLRIHARPFWSSWLLVNQRGVSGGADVTKFLEGRSCHGYSEFNRVLQVDKRVSTEMSVSFCGLTCDFSKMIPLMVERKYWSKYMNALRPKIQHKFISNHISSLTVSQGSPWKKQDDKDFKTPKLKVINLGTGAHAGDWRRNSKEIPNFPFTFPIKATTRTGGVVVVLRLKGGGGKFLKWNWKWV